MDGMKFVNLPDQLKKIFREAAFRLYDRDCDIEITQSTKPQFGHYQCNSPLKLGKELGENPRKVAEGFLQHFDDVEGIVEKLEVAGPGFINIFLKPNFLARELDRALKDSHLGVELPAKRQRIVCEFSSPNIAKEMHVGHLRSSIIGDAIARLLEFLGHDVIRLNHVGDWGTQFGMLIAFIKTHHSDKMHEIEESSLEELMGWYKKSKALFDESPSFKKMAQEEVVSLQRGDLESKRIWQSICEISRRGFQEIYDLLDIQIEERGESFYNPYLEGVVEDLEKKGLVQVDAGAKCVFLEGFFNQEGQPFPIIIQKSDGGYNYSTTDLAGFKYRIQHDKAKRIIIVTDAGQSLHFKMISEAAKKVGYLNPAEVRFDHVPFGLVLGPDGKKFKTRKGETEKLIDLLDEAIDRARLLLEQKAIPDIEHAAKVLGVGSVKYADLSCNRVKDYTFSYDRMLRFEGNTAAYILYSYVRIQSIKRKVKADIDTLMQSAHIHLDHPSELALGLHLRRFGEALAAMDEELLPNRLTDYLYHLAEHFHAFFRDCHVEGSEEQNSRLLLCQLSAKILARGLAILGIKTLDQM